MPSELSTLVFFGSGPVAAQSLDFLAKYFFIEVVFTKPENIKARIYNPVIKIAKQYKLKLSFASNKNELNKFFYTWQPKSQLGIVIDYGIIFDQTVLNSFSSGIINSHFSLLPEWRGADPITYSLLSGQTKTGVCLIKVSLGLDEGHIINCQSIDILPSHNNTNLSQELIEISNQLLLKTIPPYSKKNLLLTPQKLTPVTYSRKITKIDGAINLSKPATVLEREIRAYVGWPSSYMPLNKVNIIIHQAKASNKKLKIGKILVSPKNEIFVGCRVGSLQLLKIQPLNKKVLNSKDFLNGYKKQIC